MGQIIKLKSGKFAIRFDVPSDGGRKQKQIGGFTKQSEAAKELKKIEAEILSGNFFAASEITVDEFIKIWLKDHVSGLAPFTQRSYKNLYEAYMKRYIGKIPIAELKSHTIDKMYRELKETTTLSPRTIYSCHAILSTALNKAVKWDYIKISPMQKVEAPKKGTHEMKYWQESEIIKALDLFKGSIVEWHVKVALLTGLRQGEIGALHIDNINFKNMTFSITETLQRVPNVGLIFKEPKTEKSKATLPLTEELAKLFKERLHQIRLNKLKYANKYNHKCGGYLSVSEWGYIICPSVIGRTFRKVLQNQNEVPVIRFHDLRHTCATWLLSQGIDLKTIQEILRHADFSTTANTYSHVSIDTKKEALCKLTLNK